MSPVCFFFRWMGSAILWLRSSWGWWGRSILQTGWQPIWPAGWGPTRSNKVPIRLPQIWPPRPPPWLPPPPPQPPPPHPDPSHQSQLSASQLPRQVKDTNYLSFCFIHLLSVSLHLPILHIRVETLKITSQKCYFVFYNKRSDKVLTVFIMGGVKIFYYQLSGRTWTENNHVSVFHRII